MLLSSNPSFLISLDFKRSLTNGEAMDVMGLRSLFQDKLVVLGRRDIRSYPVPSTGFSCHLYHILVSPFLSFVVYVLPWP